MAECEQVRDGAWGCRFVSVDAASVLQVARDWQRIDLNITNLAAPCGHESSDWSDSGMRVALAGGGRLEIEWPSRVHLSLVGHPEPQCVIQPHLTTAAAALAIHRGEQPFHAGAFVIDGEAWGIIGGRGAGKSSTLVLASLRGLTVVTDDLLVVRNGKALAGARCVDLREEAARRLGTGRDLGIVGRRERWRVQLGSCPLELPLAGWILPEWGDDCLEPIRPVARFQALVSAAAIKGLPLNNPELYLNLATLPAFRWARPHGWSTALQSFEQLIDFVRQRAG